MTVTAKMICRVFVHEYVAAVFAANTLVAAGKRKNEGKDSQQTG